MSQKRRLLNLPISRQERRPRSSLTWLLCRSCCQERLVLKLSIVQTKHRGLTSLTLMQLVPGDDRVVRHICIRCINLFTYTAAILNLFIERILWDSHGANTLKVYVISHHSSGRICPFHERVKKAQELVILYHNLSL